MNPEVKRAYDQGVVDGRLERAMPEEHLRAEKIIALVCKEWGITLGEMRSVKRTAKVAYPRQVAMFILRERTRLTPRTIGLYFNKGRGAVNHGWNIIGDEYELYEDIRNRIDEIESKI